MPSNIIKGNDIAICETISKQDLLFFENVLI